jgi:hypothetical protein
MIMGLLDLKNPLILALVSLSETEAETAERCQ